LFKDFVGIVTRRPPFGWGVFVTDSPKEFSIAGRKDVMTGHLRDAPECPQWQPGSFKDY